MRSASGIDRAVVALAQAPHRIVGIGGDDQRRAQAAGLRQVGDMAAMQDVEAAVGEHQRPRQRSDALRQFAGRDDLGLEGGRRVHADRARLFLCRCLGGRPR
jgi:hypothetical protein